MREDTFSKAAMYCVAADAAAVLCSYGSLPRDLAAHFDLSGVPSGSMPRAALLLYPAAALAVCLILRAAGSAVLRRHPSLDDPMGARKCYPGIMSLCAALVVLSSTLVTLTGGACPVFMLLEPALILAALILALILEIRLRRARSGRNLG